MKIISLDIETTGLYFYEGHKITELACIEINEEKITNNIFHTYINPKRIIDKEAKKITGITEDFLIDKPEFKDIVQNFLKFIEYSDYIIIHNAKFDVGFINNELRLMNHQIKDLNEQYKILDTLELARKIHPGKKNNLDALCIRFNITKTEREVHGALIDAELLAKVYLALTQDDENNENKKLKNSHNINLNDHIEIIKSNKQELITHISYIKNLQEQIKMI